MIDGSLTPGFTVGVATDPPGPLVLASPHSGRDYPATFLATTRLTLAQLRRAEDAFVDDLVAPAAIDHGVPLIAARWGRTWLDLNRDAAEIDPAMVVDAMAADPAQASDRVAAGLGVIPRIAAHGLAIYPGRLRHAEIAARIATVHAPYHAAITKRLTAAVAANGFAVLLDCHSMPSPAAVPGGAPQVVIGDRFGTSAAPALVAAVERHFADGGFRVARNAPYAGGYTTTHHGRPGHGVHAIQIEIDRALYMDPARLVRHAGFDRVAAAFAGLVATLPTLAARLDLAPPLPMACAAE
jgi:N-formylglutamate amidohydrolase